MSVDQNLTFFSAKYIHKGWRVVVYALLHKGVTFSQCDWFIPWKERFWLAITTQNIYLNNSEWSEMTVKMNFLYSGNYNFNHQLLQIFKQNYDHFAVKPTICICNGSAMDRKKPFEKAKALEFKKKGIAWHTNASSIVSTLIYNNKLHNHGLIAQSMVSANHWLRSIETDTFLW